MQTISETYINTDRNQWVSLPYLAVVLGVVVKGGLLYLCHIKDCSHSQSESRVLHVYTSTSIVDEIKGKHIQSLYLAGESETYHFFLEDPNPD